MKNQKSTLTSKTFKLEKFQIAAIKNLNVITGGGGGGIVPPTINQDEDDDTEL